MCRKLICLSSFVLVVAIGSVSQAGLAEWEATISGANPLHWYKFDETTGTDCVDSGSAGLNGKYSDVFLSQEGYFGAGTAVRFDRSGDNRVNLTGGTDLYTSWTAEYIVKNMKPAAANDSQALHDSESTSVRLSGWISLGEVGFTLYGVEDYRFTPEEGLTLEDLVIPVGEWMHLTWRRDDAGGTQMFFNSKLVGTHTSSVAFPRLRIGARGAGPADMLNAFLDESVVFGRALTDAEIIAHAAAAGLAGFSANNPSPADGALHQDTWASLSWLPGDTAVSHDMYFGESFDDVDDGTGGTFQGNQTATSFTVGVAGFPYPDGLVQGTTYYWRIDEVEADGTKIHKGDVWSFTVSAPLSEALDTSLNFTTDGGADWFSQTTMSRYDGDAAQSGDISHGQDSWMQTTVSGTGTIKFYWKVSSEEDFDFLEFYIDGSLQDRISGFLVNWEQKWYTISTSGSHTLEWRYVKDGSGNFGSDCGWVDKVEWLTTP